MPDNFPHPCNQPGCGLITKNRYCAAHTVEHKKAIYEAAKDSAKEYNQQRPWYHAWYKSRRWREYRIKYLTFHPFCKQCEKEGRMTFATEVDHIIPFKGDVKLFWDEDNHQALCESCHSKKTAREQTRK